MLRISIPRGLRILAVLHLTLCAISVTYAPWTEEDERKRNIKIKEEELRDYETKTGGAREVFGKGDDDLTTAIDYGTGAESNVVPPPSRQMSHKHRHGGRNRHSLSPDAVRRGKKQERPIEQMGPSGSGGNWCFSCASPWSSLSGDMQQVIRNLLDVRRATYPSAEFVSSECVQPKHLDSLPREACVNSYCQTLVLTDHEKGKAFTMRGCAEKYGAIDETLLKTRGDNTCKSLHPNIDVIECVCKRRRYCYSGPDRRSLNRYNSPNSPLYANQTQSRGTAEAISSSNIHWPNSAHSTAHAKILYAVCFMAFVILSRSVIAAR